MTMKAPPLKSQGIKTKLVPFIQSILPASFEGVWIEPFMGTGAVAFNILPSRALLCDTNPHLIRFYEQIQQGLITDQVVRDFLETEGALLLKKGEFHYYEVRNRFNQTQNPLDFLFLNRAGFNGMIRFNQKGNFNIPFCRKINRFSKSYITKITNQVGYVSTLLVEKDFQFKCQSFESTISSARQGDLIYCDPPYIGRHVDYYNGWTEESETQLYQLLEATPALFVLSTWYKNKYRENNYIQSLWHEFNIITKEHFYHVGAKESNRNAMTEALILNFDPPLKVS